MKSHVKILLIVCLLIIIVMIPDTAMAAPGGAIVKGIFKTWWGKILLLVLAIIFLPLIIYVKTREYFAVRKNKKVLSQLGLINKDFDWLNLRKNVTNVYERVHIAWLNEQMEEVSEYVTSWYWQNQQLVHLDEWNKNGLKNISKVDHVNHIKPLYLAISDEDDLSGSKIVFVISSYIEDYLVEVETNRVVKGKKGYSDEEFIWVMEYTDGKWRLDDIQESSLSLVFAKMKNSVPETVLQRAGSAQLRLK